MADVNRFVLYANDRPAASALITETISKRREDGEVSEASYEVRTSVGLNCGSYDDMGEALVAAAENVLNMHEGGQRS